MTYGWALLIVLVVGAVLWWYVISPKMMPKRGCEVGDLRIYAADWAYKDDGTFQVLIENGIAAKINITAVTVDGTPLTTGVPQTIDTGKKSTTISGTLTDPGDVGDTVEPTVVVTYDIIDGLQDQDWTCDLRGTVS
jgi:hypothetical protein